MMKLLKTINPQNATPEEFNKYAIREASRAIVIDEDNNIAILHVTNEKYYKLPGGGIEKGEDKKTALQRECLEEIGCSIEVIDEIGSIIEHRKMFKLNQTSYCYLAKIQGEKGIPQFTKEELAEGFEQLWVPYNKALSLVHNNIASDLEGRSYIVPRDTFFLQEAEQKFKKFLT
jgi:8-oxo-dGTP diphosphatase